MESPRSSSETFTRKMRKATREIHDISDHLVNAKLVFALSDPGVWADGLLVFYEIFRYLEKHVEHPVLLPELRRTEAFEKDLRFYLGPNWEKNYTPRESVCKYLLHLENIKNNNKILLLAYVYHLYMGLLSGGTILRKKRIYFQQKRLNTKEIPGEAVTEFGGQNLYALKKKLRQEMDSEASRLDTKTKNLLIEESKTVFILNNTIIRSVKGAGRALAVKGLKYGSIIAAVILIIYSIVTFMII